MDEDAVQAQPGGRMLCLPDLTALQTLRHEWVLRRRARPLIPCPERTPMPSRTMDHNDRARLLSVYLRPWTLHRELSSFVVRHLADLDVIMPAEALAQSRRRLSNKSTLTQQAQRGFHVFISQNH